MNKYLQHEFMTNISLPPRAYPLLLSSDTRSIEGIALVNPLTPIPCGGAERERYCVLTAASQVSRLWLHCSSIVLARKRMQTSWPKFALL